MTVYPYDIALALQAAKARTQEERAKVLASFQIDEDLRIPFNKLKS